MGACLGKTVQKMKHKSTKRVVMVGLDNAGKTTILYKLALDQIVSTIPTVGLNIESITYKDIKFNVWDLGGQLRYNILYTLYIYIYSKYVQYFIYFYRQKIRSLWSNYYQDTDAVIFVIDSNEPQRVDELKHDNAKTELYKVLKSKHLSDAVLLIFANKQDLPNSININEITRRLELESLQNRSWMIQETCAMTGEGLYEGLEWLSNAIKNRNNRQKGRFIQNTQRYNQLND